MCGIVGYLNLNGHLLRAEENYLPQMCNSIRHRGPDQEGMTILGPVALGMTRLSIIDLVTGQQPIANEDKTIWIVFNGEIYNYKELQIKVRALGHVLSTNSDTETIVHLYEEYGVDCLRYLEGMFAFAIWDISRQRLFIARDRIGEKPLHWGIFDGQFIFSSEIKGILSHPKSRRELDPESLSKYLALEYVPAPNSMFKGINKLMPAHYMLIEAGQISIAHYWKPELTSKQLSEGQATEQLLGLLTKSVELRLISDVPLGVFLSGGVDSSAITALASQLSSKPVKTFSIGFTDPSFDEADYARQAASLFKTEHLAFTFLPSMAEQTMKELWQVLDEPLADASILPTFFLAKMTRKEVTVALSGEGGDELFGGYPTYQAHRLATIWERLPAFLRRGLLEPAINQLPVSYNNLSFDYKLKRFIKAVDKPPILRHLQWMGSIPVEEQPSLLRPELSALAIPVSHDKEEGLLHSLLGDRNVLMSQLNGDLIDKIMRVDLSTYLPDDLLVKSDRASMAASLEVRLPFLAFPLVEFALSLPASMKLKGLTTKYLLKKALAPLLPRRIIKRTKKGFGIPIGKWLKGEFKPLVGELLSRDFVNKQGIFNSTYVSALLHQHNEGYVDRRKELWTLVMFQCWWHKYFMANHRSSIW